MSDPIVRIVRREALLSVLSTVRLETSHVEYLCKKAEAVKALESRVAELYKKLEKAREERNAARVKYEQPLLARVAELKTDLEEWLEWIEEVLRDEEVVDGAYNSLVWNDIQNSKDLLCRTPEQSRAEIEDAPPLPDGWEYVGMGDAMEEGEECLLWGSVQAWLGPASCGQSPNLHYARRKQPEREACDKPDPAPALVIPADIAWDLNRPGELIAQLRGKGYKFRWDQDGIVGWRE